PHPAPGRSVRRHPPRPGSAPRFMKYRLELAATAKADPSHSFPNPWQIALGRRVAVHARLLDELFGVIVDRPAVAAARGVDVNRPGIDEIAMLGGKGHLIVNGLAMVGKLEGRVVDAVELPEHLQRAGLAPGEVVGENPRQALECSPSQVLALE